MDCVCITKVSMRNLASGKVRARNGYFFNAKTSLKSDSNLRQATGHLVGVTSKFHSNIELTPKNTHLINLAALKNKNNGYIRAQLSFADAKLRCQLTSSSEINLKYVDKIGGSLNDLSRYTNFKCIEKLYPVADIVINSGDNYFVDENLNTNNLYTKVDEGILSQDYDAKLTYIQPSSIATAGSFRYKFAVDLHTVPRESLFLLRASAPMVNYASTISPVYNIKNIRLEDPSGNLIVKYKDFVVRGDSDYFSDYVNFGTYVTEPELNNAAKKDWRADYEIFQSGTALNPYTVNMDVEAECLDFQFTDGYDLGYESGCLVPSSVLNSYNLPPTPSLRITAIELCNNGEFFQNRNNYLSIYSDVSANGFRLLKQIKPDQFLVYDHSNEIYPQVNSIWTHRNANGKLFDNVTESGANVLLGALNNFQDSVKLIYSSIQDSGKLNLRFSWGPEVLSNILGGDFDNSFDLTLSRKFYSTFDDFFTIDNIELKVLAKKADGTRDYYLDVVGYSDDKLLNVTSQVGGFLQNASGDFGFYPMSSGFKNINDLGISTVPISDKHQYFINELSNNDGADHYVLTTQPMVNTTSLKEYTIPLKIYKDRVNLGESIDYSISSYFESLYLDIYPLPSGAEISKISLSVSLKPSNALMLHTLGRSSDKELNRRNITLLPNGDIKSTNGSLLENIPHKYTNDQTLKTNYSTRWRGVTGNVLAGPFNHSQFDLSFYNPPMYTPFLNGYFAFNYQDGDYVLPEYSFENSKLDCVTSGLLVGNCEKISNLGLRFNSNSLFDQNTQYQTIDWTLEPNYYLHELHNQITDNFINAIKVTGPSGYISFNDVNTSGGFAIYTRFSPGESDALVEYLVDEYNNPIVTFENYAAYSGIIFNSLDFAVGFSGGKLFGMCKDTDGNSISIHGDKYYFEYQYPLPLMLSYNENDNKLRLYANELIGASEPFVANYSESPIVFGSGVSGFVTDIGISTLIGPSGHISESGINILSSGELNKTIKQELYSNFSRELYTYIDDKDWKFGDFNICMFNHEYDRFTTITDRDFISHRFVSSGLAYSEFTNMVLPSNINLSGVSYHTQIENDFLRFNLLDASSLSTKFYAANNRIQKILPRGYQFEKEAICVDTVLNYTIDNDVMWPDGKTGPKFIVSLYTPNKEPRDYPTTNYGLVNRDIHYLNSDCHFALKRIISTFNFNSLIDNSEPWSNFPENNKFREFHHSYFSKDIDDMFLQYDLVYPSGHPFDSNIKIYSSTVRLKDALISQSGINDNLNLQTSGDTVARSNLNLATPLTYAISGDNINLYTSGNPIDYINNNLSIYISGGVWSSLNLHAIGHSGIYDSFGLYCSANFGDYQRLSLYTQNDLIDQMASGYMPLYAMNKAKEFSDNFLELYVRGFSGENFLPNSKINLYTEVTNITKNNASINLFITNFINENNSNINLFVANTSSIGVKLGDNVINWDVNNVGLDISVLENEFASLLANDEIRGVELICYGDCK